MKRSVLARPNLKLFLLAAILVLALQDVVSRSQGSNVVQARLRTKERLSDEALHHLLQEATHTATPDLCMQISDEYHRRGEMKRALFFLRRAELLADQLD